MGIEPVPLPRVVGDPCENKRDRKHHGRGKGLSQVTLAMGAGQLMLF